MGAIIFVGLITEHICNTEVAHQVDRCNFFGSFLQTKIDECRQVSVITPLKPDIRQEESVKHWFQENGHLIRDSALSFRRF